MSPRAPIDDIRFVTFQPGHLAALDLRADIAAATPALGDPRFAEALARGYGLSAVAGFRTIGCGGVLEMWPGVGRAWAAPASRLGRRHWPAITAMALFVFDAAHAAGMRRIETVVREDFPAGHRWARRLGFVPEGVMRRWGPDGLDYRLYARITDDEIAGLENLEGEAVQVLVNGGEAATAPAAGVGGRPKAGAETEGAV